MHLLLPLVLAVRERNGERVVGSKTKALRESENTGHSEYTGELQF